MAYSYLNGILEIANVFVSLFVLIYAWSFLRQTADVKDRRPWVFLFIAAIIFFLFELVGVLNVFEISKIPGLRSFLESTFIALILFVFIFQYDLILKSDLILITRKIRENEDEESFDSRIKNIQDMELDLPKKKKSSKKVQITKTPAKKKQTKNVTKKKTSKKKK